MAENDDAGQGKASGSGSGVRKLSVQVITGQKTSFRGGEQLPPFKASTRRKSSVVNMDAWKQHHRGSLNKSTWAGASGSSRDSSPQRLREASLEKPAVPASLSGLGGSFREGSRGVSDQTTTGNKPDVQTGGERRPSLAWPGMSSPNSGIKDGDASTPDASMAQFKVLMPRSLLSSPCILQYMRAPPRLGSYAQGAHSSGQGRN